MGEAVEQPELSQTIVGMQICTSTLENSLAISSKIKPIHMT